MVDVYAVELVGAMKFELTKDGKKLDSNSFVAVFNQQYSSLLNNRLIVLLP